jgi:hypothetical protein
MKKIEISDKLYKELENTKGHVDIKKHIKMMIESGIYHYKKLLDSLPDEF